MQNHFSPSSLQASPSSSLNSSIDQDAMRPLSKKRAIVIDLSCNDETSISQNRIASQDILPNTTEASPPSSLLAASDVSCQKSKGISKMKTTKNKSPASKKANKLASENKMAMSKSSKKAQITNIQEIDDDDFCKGNEFGSRPQIIQVQPFTIIPLRRPFVIDLQDQRNQEKGLEEGKSYTPQELFMKNMAQRSKQTSTKFVQSEVVCYDDDGPKVMKFWLPSKSVDLEVKDNRRKTRSNVRNAGLSLLKDQFYDKYVDKEILTRFNVAKYRFDNPKCNSAISQLVASVSNRIHFGQKRAIVHDYPTIPLNDFKHKIFAECLKIQLRKRKFIYLD